jgi:hypothetical protein
LLYNCQPSRDLSLTGQQASDGKLLPCPLWNHCHTVKFFLCYRLRFTCFIFCSHSRCSFKEIWIIKSYLLAHGVAISMALHPVFLGVGFFCLSPVLQCQSAGMNSLSFCVCEQALSFAFTFWSYFNQADALVLFCFFKFTSNLEGTKKLGHPFSNTFSALLPFFLPTYVIFNLSCSFLMIFLRMILDSFLSISFWI